MAQEGRYDGPEQLCHTVGKSPCHSLKPNSTCGTIKTMGHCRQSLLPTSAWQTKEERLNYVFVNIPTYKKQRNTLKLGTAHFRNHTAAFLPRYFYLVTKLVQLIYFPAFLTGLSTWGDPPKPAGKYRTRGSLTWKVWKKLQQDGKVGAIYGTASSEDPWRSRLENLLSSHGGRSPMESQGREAQESVTFLWVQPQALTHTVHINPA